jgi:hypothetical protein
MIAPRHQNEEIAQKGWEIFAGKIEPTLRPDQQGQLVAIDTVTGEYEISPDDVQAVLKLSQRVTPGKFYFVRTGHSTPYRVGAIVPRVHA